MSLKSLWGIRVQLWEGRWQRSLTPLLPLTLRCGRKRDTATLQNQVPVQGGEKSHLQGRAKSSKESVGHGRRVCKGDLSTNIY